MLALTFGDPIAHGHAIAGIKAIHARVHGELARTDRRLSRRHAVFGRGSGPGAVGACDADRFGAARVRATGCAVVSRPIAITYCARPPTSRSRLGPMTASCRARGPRSRHIWRRNTRPAGSQSAPTHAWIVDAVLFPPLSAISGPFAWVNRVITLGLLPPFVRDQYHYAWTSGRERQFKRVTGAIRGLRRVTPRALACGRRRGVRS